MHLGRSNQAGCQVVRHSNHHHRNSSIITTPAGSSKPCYPHWQWCPCMSRSHFLNLAQYITLYDPTWLKRWDSTVSVRELVNPDSWGDTSNVRTRRGHSNKYTGYFFAWLTLEAAQSIQPFPLGSMFSRTKPSTSSGNISCGKRSG